MSRYILVRAAIQRSEAVPDVKLETFFSSCQTVWVIVDACIVVYVCVCLCLNVREVYEACAMVPLLVPSDGALGGRVAVFAGAIAGAGRAE